MRRLRIASQRMSSCSAPVLFCVRSWLMLLYLLLPRSTRSVRIGGTPTRGGAATVCDDGVLLRNGHCLHDDSLLDLTALVDNEEKLFAYGEQEFMCCCMAVDGTHWDSPRGGVRCALQDKDGPRGWRSGCGGLLSGSHSWYKMRRYGGTDLPDLGKCVVQLRDVPDVALCAAMPSAFAFDETGVCRPLPDPLAEWESDRGQAAAAMVGFERTMCNPFAGWVSRTFYTEHTDARGSRVAVRLRRTRNTVELTMFKKQSWQIVMDWDAARSAVFVPRTQGGMEEVQTLVSVDHGLSHIELVPAWAGSGAAFRPEALRIHLLDGTSEELTSGVWYPDDFVHFLYKSASLQRSEHGADFSRNKSQGALDLLDAGDLGVLDYTYSGIGTVSEPAGYVGQALGKAVFAPLAGLAVVFHRIVRHGSLASEDTARADEIFQALVGNGTDATGCAFGTFCSSVAAITAVPHALYRYYKVKNDLRISGVSKLFKELQCNTKLTRCSRNILATKYMPCDAIPTGDIGGAT